jgi:hypothetical protein
MLLGIAIKKKIFRKMKRVKNSDIHGEASIATSSSSGKLSYVAKTYIRKIDLSSYG